MHEKHIKGSGLAPLWQASDILAVCDLRAFVDHNASKYLATQHRKVKANVFGEPSVKLPDLGKRMDRRYLETSLQVLAEELPEPIPIVRLTDRNTRPQGFRRAAAAARLNGRVAGPRDYTED